MFVKKMTLIIFILAFVVGFVWLIWTLFSHTSGDWEWKDIKIGETEFRTRFANTTFLRTKGLSGTPELDEKEGMLFEFPYQAKYGFWMKGMLMPIDMVWVNSEQKVVDISKNAQPQPGIIDAMLQMYYPQEPVKWVVELSSGSAEKFHIQKGDTMQILE